MIYAPARRNVVAFLLKSSSSKLDQENNKENTISNRPSIVQMIDLPSYPIKMEEPNKNQKEFKIPNYITINDFKFS